MLELCDMARNVQSLRLNERILLLDFVLGPGTSAYKLVKPMVGRSARSSLHNQDTHYIRDRQSQYRSTKYHVARLAKLKLIEKMMDQDSAHRAKPYQPTEYGVYSTLANEYLSSIIIIGLIRNYGNHPLFRYFVYPWIRRDTILNIPDDPIFSHLSSYLRGCCAAVKDTIDYLDDPEDLFMWEDVRTGSDEAKALSDFLAQKFGWGWLCDTEIQRSNSKVIRVRAGSNSVLVTLRDDRKKVTVSYKGKRQLELSVKKSSNKLIVQKPQRQLDDTYMESFIATHHKLVQQLIFSIVMDDSIESEIRVILKQDETFRKAIQETKNRFEQRNNLFQ